MNWNTARGYCWDRALRLLGRRPGRTMAAIALIGVAMALPGLVLMTWQMLAPYVDRIPVAEATVFVAPSASAAEVRSLQAGIEGIEGVAGVTLVSREKAWARLQQRTASAKGAGDLGSNPLPDILVVQFAPRTPPVAVESAAASMRKLARADSVQAELDWYRRFDALGRVALGAFAGTAAALALLLAALVVGLVRSLVAIDPVEVRLLDQVGADADFLRMPSLYGGALIFGLGAACGLGLIALVRGAANPALALVGKAFGGASLALAFPAWPLVVAFVALWVICGAAVGSLSAPRSARLVTASR